MSRFPKTHRITLTVTFDKPCSGRFARAAVADSIHGEFYVGAGPDRAPDRFKVRGAKVARKESDR